MVTLLTKYEASYYCSEGEKGIEKYNYEINGVLERTLVKVISIGLLKLLLSCSPYKHQWNEE